MVALALEVADDALLILAPVGRDAEVIRQMLESGRIAGAAADGARLAQSIREGRAAGAIVTEEALSSFDRGLLEAALTDQPPWSDFPMILLSRRGGPLRQGARYIEELGNVTILERPLHPATLISAGRSAIRARRRQRQAQVYLRRREEAETALRELAGSLEQKVEERTRALALVNDRLTAEIAERQRAEAELLQSQKMEAIGQLTGGVAHDFNNLLTAVIGSLEMLARRLTDPKQERLARNALQAAERGAKLTQQMLAFSRRQRLAPSAVDANAVICRMDELLARSLGTHVQLETRLDPKLWVALVDPTQLEVMILNLAINARDAMPAGGRLSIETRNVDHPPPPLMAQLSPGPYVAICVTDQGVGMTPEVLAKAFDPFFTTKEQGKGTGLGLSQVYGFARQSGGTVAIDTRPGEGTAVTIYLPRTHAPVAVETPSETPASPPRRLRLLLVDDDHDVRVVTASMLEDLGHEVTAVESGSHALAALTEARFDLLLTDVAMPGMNGAELARKVRELAPDLPVLFASGYADIAAFGDSLSSEDLIKKPFGVNEIAVRLEQAMIRERLGRSATQRSDEPASPQAE